MSTTTEIDTLEVQNHKDNQEHGISLECNNNNKMLITAQDHQNLLIKGDVDSMSEETESITLTADKEDSSSSRSSDNTTEDEESEIIQLHIEEEEEEDDYNIMLNRPGYKRMDLTGESESDKDLIIYSLNESLQIHKEIVERIQNEKDDIEDQFEQEKIKERNEIEQERLKVESKKEQSQQQVNKLESVYQSLLKELEAKKLEYRRMETRFYSHVKSIRATDEDLSTIQLQINQLISQANNLCMSIKSSMNNKDNILESWWPQDTIIHQYIQRYLLPLDSTLISILTEKMIMEIIMQDILQTSIHPGVSLNNAFGTIHTWVEKRNTSWATRMKHQISSFVVKQSNEEQDKIEAAKEQITQKILTLLSQVYLDTNKLKRKVSTLVNKATKLNLAIKCQDIQIDILPITEGHDFNKNIMDSVNTSGEHILLVISPPFVAAGQDGWIIPAKVYCV